MIHLAKLAIFIVGFSLMTFAAHLVFYSLLIYVIPESIASIWGYFIWSILRIVVMASVVSILASVILNFRMLPMMMIVVIVYCFDYLVVMGAFEFGQKTPLNDTVIASFFWGAAIGLVCFLLQNALKAE